MGHPPGKSEERVIVCAKCGKENEDHYKFCLGCGAELASAASVAQAPTETPPQEEVPEQPPAPQAPRPAPTPLSRPAAESPPEPTPAPTPQEAASGPSGCPHCGANNPPGFTFCGNCGSRLTPAPEPVPVASPDEQVEPAADAGPRTLGQLALIRPDGTPDGTFALCEPDTIAGRRSGPLFEQDDYLSPHHARFYREGEHVMVEDLASQNGVFVRITGGEPLVDGDIFRVGQELLRFDTIAKPRPAEDGTFILGGPNPGYWGRLSLIVGHGVDGSAFPLMGDEMVLGRDRGDILFSDDGYVSSTHAKLTLAPDGGVRLVDLGSSNGTFIRLREPRAITPGTFVLLGQQLFRFEAD
jgi:hypothetical protein